MVFILVVSFVACPASADTVDEVVDGLTKHDYGSKEFKAAQEKAKLLDVAQAQQAAQKIVNKVTTQSQDQVRTVLNLYKLGLKAAPDNPPDPETGRKTGQCNQLRHE